MCRWAFMVLHLTTFSLCILLSSCPYSSGFSEKHMPKHYLIFCPLSVYFRDTSSQSTLLSMDCCVSLCHVLDVVTNYPWCFNFLCTLMSLKFKMLFVFLSCKVAALWSLLGLAGSGKARVSFSLCTDFSQKRTQWWTGICCALVCNLQKVFFS